MHVGYYSATTIQVVVRERTRVMRKAVVVMNLVVVVVRLAAREVEVLGAV